MSGKIGGGVVALGVRLHIHAGVELIVADELPDLGGDVVLHPPLDHLILDRGVLHALEDLFLLHPQDLGQPLSDECGVIAALGGDFGVGGDAALFLLLLLGKSGALFQLGHRPLGRRLLSLHDVLGGDDDVVNVGGDGQPVAFGVVNGAPGRGHQQVPGLLVNGLLLQLVVLADLHVPQLPEQRDKDNHPEDHHQENGAAQDGPVGPAVTGPGFCFARSLCHAGLLVKSPCGRFPKEEGVRKYTIFLRPALSLSLLGLDERYVPTHWKYAWNPLKISLVLSKRPLFSVSPSAR